VHVIEAGFATSSNLAFGAIQTIASMIRHSTVLAARANDKGMFATAFTR
jgi:L-lactate permease